MVTFTSIIVIVDVAFQFIINMIVTIPDVRINVGSVVVVRIHVVNGVTN